MTDHRIAKRDNLAVSGIFEVRGEREIIVDNILLAIEEMEENKSHGTRRGNEYGPEATGGGTRYT